MDHVRCRVIARRVDRACGRIAASNSVDGPANTRVIPCDRSDALLELTSADRSRLWRNGNADLLSNDTNGSGSRLGGVFSACGRHHNSNILRNHRRTIGASHIYCADRSTAPTTRLTDQRTPDISPETFAVKWATWPALTTADCGETLIVINRCCTSPHPKANKTAQRRNEIFQDLIHAINIPRIRLSSPVA